VGKRTSWVSIPVIVIMSLVAKTLFLSCPLPLGEG
jgi:hypothetical protein